MVFYRFFLNGMNDLCESPVLRGYILLCESVLITNRMKFVCNPNIQKH